ncbi:glycosyltransferase family 9 protein [Candidatus Saganbacteria bacterium]|nr:glycosyltransferase family 9 protein [Candidatus Saganbacteria bacterium]
MDKKIKNILIIRPDAIGDLVLTLPAIQAIRKNFPGAKITVLAREYTRPLLANHPAIDEIICDYDLKKYNFDLSINFYNQFQDTWAAFKAKIPSRLGDSSRVLTSWMNNLRVFRHWEDQNRHEIDLNFALLAPLGIKDRPEKPKLVIAPDSLAKIKTLLERNAVSSGDRLAGLHIGAATSRSWTIEGFAKIADWLAKEKNYRVIILGGEAELCRAKKMAELLHCRFINFVGQLPLADLVAMISRLNFYLGMDTGPSHIAAALNIPLVMLFLNKQAPPTRWGPFKVRHLTVARQKGEENIPAERVAAACDTVIQGQGALTPEEAFLHWQNEARRLQNTVL